MELFDPRRDDNTESVLVEDLAFGSDELSAGIMFRAFIDFKLCGNGCL